MRFDTIMIFKPHISRIKPVLIHIITMFPCDTVIANISVTDDHVHNICMKLEQLEAVGSANWSGWWYLQKTLQKGFGKSTFGHIF